MSEAPLLDEGIEDLSVEEHLEERPLHRGAVLEEQLLVEQVRDVPGSLRGSGHQGNQTLPREIRNTIGCTQGVTVLGGVSPVVTNHGCKKPQEDFPDLHIHRFLYHMTIT